MRVFTLMVACWLSLVTSAAAQTASRWLIVPSTSGADADWVEPALVQVRAALVEQGVALRSSDQAATVFEEEESVPPATLSEADLERWTSLSGGAVHDLAEGDYKAALVQLRAAQAMSRRAIEELNREPGRAILVFDTCLYVVRAVLETESESHARATARECRQLVPRGDPSPYMHPPAVTKLLRKVDKLQARQSGKVRVTSSPSGCAARLNGVLLGETPASIDDLFPGQYRVQVECNPAERGRVHGVTVGVGRTKRRVDSRFDDSVESRPELRLHYASTVDEQKYRLSHAQRIAKRVGDEVVVLLSMPTLETMELVKVAPGSAEPEALVRVSAGPSGPTKADLASAARALRGGLCVDLTPSPSSLPCDGTDGAAAAEPKRTGKRGRSSRRGS